tara:strand:- start:547 stop:756 length:210 start_codon:yes stop_codon:yes gene_type:complete
MIKGINEHSLIKIVLLIKVFKRPNEVVASFSINDIKYYIKSYGKNIEKINKEGTYSGVDSVLTKVINAV